MIIHMKCFMLIEKYKVIYVVIAWGWLLLVTSVQCCHDNDNVGLQVQQRERTSFFTASSFSFPSVSRYCSIVVESYCCCYSDRESVAFIPSRGVLTSKIQSKE